MSVIFNRKSIRRYTEEKVSEEKLELLLKAAMAAPENILLQAEDMGLGAVWMGVYPMEDRVKALKELLQIPEFITPLNIISIGYPAEKRDAVDRFDKSRIHYDKW